MNNRDFLDSSVLIEYYKATRTDLLEALLDAAEPQLLVQSGSTEIITSTGEILSVEPGNLKKKSIFDLCICQTVISEYLLHCLIFDSGEKSPLTIKESGKIASLIALNDHSVFLNLFRYLPDNNRIVNLAPGFMAKYNLLPNDALILSICAIYEIKALASYDATDFGPACSIEGITLLQSVTDLEDYKSNL